MPESAGITRRAADPSLFGRSWERARVINHPLLRTNTAAPRQHIAPPRPAARSDRRQCVRFTASASHSPLDHHDSPSTRTRRLRPAPRARCRAPHTPPPPPCRPSFPCRSGDARRAPWPSGRLAVDQTEKRPACGPLPAGRRPPSPTGGAHEASGPTARPRAGVDGRKRNGPARRAEPAGRLAD